MLTFYYMKINILPLDKTNGMQAKLEIRLFCGISTEYKCHRSEMHELPKVGLKVIYLALVIYNPDRGDPGHINTAKGGPGEEELPG